MLDKNTIAEIAQNWKKSQKYTEAITSTMRAEHMSIPFIRKLVDENPIKLVVDIANESKHSLCYELFNYNCQNSLIL